MFRLFFTAIMLFVATFAYADKATDMLLPSVEVHNGNIRGSGTAVKVDDVQGTFIMTNYHVIQGKNTISVRFYGETEDYLAFVYSYDKDKDIAVLVAPHKAQHVVIMGNASDVQVFDDAFCVGNSHGNGIVPSVGIVTAVQYAAQSRLMTRTDCKIVSGNSGGGLYVQRGEHWIYVGMPTAVGTEPIMTPFGYIRTNVAHLGIAVRIEDILKHLTYYRVLPVTSLLPNVGPS